MVLPLLLKRTRRGILWIEASRETGLGHLARSLPLARVFGPTRAALWIRTDRPAVVRRFLQSRAWIGQGRDVTRLWPDGTSDATMAGAVCCARPEWLWLDSYRVSPSTAARAAHGLPFFEIRDDGMPGTLGARGIVRPFGTGRDPSGAKRWRGPRFALVDPTFRSLPRPRTRAGKPPRILVSFGAGRYRSREEGVVRALTRAGWEVLRTARSPGAMTPLLARAEVVVTTASVTGLEACAAGRATILVTFDRAQHAVARGLARAGAVRTAHAGDGPAEVASLVSELRAHPALSLRLGRTARRLLDGSGPRRVAQRLQRACR